ncbi:hypothetical protein HHX47_DHR3001142 [Lentinula edodes]|nr:hypothetical protein HHX47_DHR3001142 [Lentinula edodes]
MDSEGHSRKSHCFLPSSKPILPDGFKFGTLAYYYQRRQSTNREELVEDIIREELQDIAGTAHFIGTLRAANGSDGDVASVATTYLSFDDTNTESESNFDSEVDTDGL